MILFVRHGETNLNAKHIIAGARMDISLNENGFKQVEKTAKELQNQNIDIVFCSPMLRAKQTAAAILKYHENTPIVYDKRLIERDWGEFDGKPDSLLPKNYWHFDVVLPDFVESVDEMYLRLNSLYKEILSLHKNKTILVVAHNGVGRISRYIFNGIPKSRDLNEYCLNNAEICKLV